MNNYQLSVKSYPLYKDSGVEWLGNVPEHWEVVRAKDICYIFVPQRDKPDLNEENGIPWITSDLLGNAKIDSGKVKYWVDKGEIKHKRIRKVPANSVLASCIGEFSLTAINQFAVVINQQIQAYSYIKKQSSEFINYQIQANVTKVYYETVATETTIKYINKEKFSFTPLYLPPPSEQKAIANYLDTKTAQIDRKIDLLTQKATQYSNLKQSLINETVTRGLDKSVPMKDSGIEWIGDIPGHWDVKRFKEIFHKTHSGWTPDTTKQESFYGSNVWVTIRDMNDIYISDSLNKLSNQAIQESGISLTPKGSLLFSFKLSIGKIAFAGCDLYTNEAIISIEEGKNINLNYFYYTLPVFLILNAKENIYGAKLLNQSLIFNTSLLFPPLTEQKAIADYLDSKTTQIDQIIQTINTQIEKLKELRKTLINDVVTGKIRVT